MIKDENYITIQGWMVSKLKLADTELIVYALIYGFCQDGKNRFTGSLKYIMSWTNKSKPSVIRALKKLVEKGFLCKHEVFKNDVQFNEYTCNDLKEVVTILYQGGNDSLLGGGNDSLLGGGNDSLPNNTIIDNTIIDNTNNNNSISSFSNERGEKELPNSLQKDHIADAGKMINNQSLNEKEEKKKEKSSAKKEKAETLESFDLPPEKLEVLIEWLDYRKEIKKTIKAKSTIRGLVKKFEEHDLTLLKYVVSSSINNGWQGLFWERVANYKKGNKNDSTGSKKPISLSQALGKFDTNRDNEF